MNNDLQQETALIVVWTRELVVFLILNLLVSETYFAWLLARRRNKNVLKKKC